MNNETDVINTNILEKKDIEHLPEPVKNYIIQSNTLGKPKAKTGRLKQKGMFNVNAKKWTPMVAEQYFNMEKGEFIWKAKASIMHVVDKYVNKKGSLTVKLFNLIKLGEATGEEINQGEALRFLTEMIWFPSALFSDKISWEEIDKNTARAYIKYGDKSDSADFYFNSNGEITKITAKRYREVNGKFELNNWEIPKLEYKTFDGIKIPYKAEVTWKLEEGDLCYYKFEITEIEYNCNERY